MDLSGSVVLITGSSRGIGLGLVSRFLCLNATVIATCRTPDTAHALHELKNQHSAHLFVLPLDITSKLSFEELKNAILKINIQSIDILIPNAAIASSNHPFDPVLSASVQDMTDLFKTNVIGTMLTMQTFYPMLSGCKIIAPISSRLGSIHLTASGKSGSGVASYRVSKAALNMYAVTFANDELVSASGTKVILLHPGWVETDMGSAGGRKPPVTIESSCEGIANIILTAASVQRDPNVVVRKYPEFVSALRSNKCVFTTFEGELYDW